MDVESFSLKYTLQYVFENFENTHHINCFIHYYYNREWLAYHYHVLPLRYLIVAIDPRSETSPREIFDRYRFIHDDPITIIEWTRDEDYMSVEEKEDAEARAYYNFGNISLTLLQHRARQRVFYYKCLQKLKEEKRTWTLLTDSDEFLHINYPVALRQASAAMSSSSSSSSQFTIPSMSEFGSVRTFLHHELQRPGTNLTQSPCIQIPRLRFGAQEDDTTIGNNNNVAIPDGWNAKYFLTLRWFHHAKPEQHHLNKISKVLLDVSQIQWSQLIPVDSIHRPIKEFCSQRKLHITSPESVLVINHYLGSWEQFSYRSDARIDDIRSQKQYNKQATISGGISHDIVPWLSGFVEKEGELNAKALLDGVGVLIPKKSTTGQQSTFIPPLPDNQYHQFTDPTTQKCALLFFGLPRAFKDLVLPSIQKNLINPNAQYHCDVFVHYYHQTEEKQGRLNQGGKLDPTEIRLLEKAVHDSASTAKAPPLVIFTADTEADFWSVRNATIQKYRNAKSPQTGKYLYFPYKARTYHYPSSLDNIVKQWHSIQGAWELMERTAHDKNVVYSRVGMFRSDVVYVTPIDINRIDRENLDADNSHAVVAPFGRMPVNDRMFYGPTKAVRIWATQRFALVDEYVKVCEPGWAMHSERFLDGAIIPAIQALGINIVINPDICFLRCRADYSVVTSDCHLGGATRGVKRKQMKELVEKTVERSCSSESAVTVNHKAIQCQQAGYLLS